MMNPQNIKVIDSWYIPAFGIIAELYHNYDGLASGMIVESAKTDKEWRVGKRVLFNHTFDRQKRFDNEVTTDIRLSFGSMENRESSSKNILDKEMQNIFQYQLQPLKHDSKPDIGDILIIVQNNFNK